MSASFNACGHHDPPHAELCPHLWVHRGAPMPFVRCFTGRGVQVELLCPACARARDEDRVVVARPICAPCFQANLGTHGEHLGTRGYPEIRERLISAKPELHTTELPSAVLDIAVATDLPDRVYVYTEDHHIGWVDIQTGRSHRITCMELPPESDRRSWSGHKLRPVLHVSADGHYAAVVRDFGRLGAIVDLRSRRRTMGLESNCHKPHSVPFSVAFLHREGHTHLVHRSFDLQISDPATGAPVQADNPTTAWVNGTIQPNPSQTCLLVDGWQPAARGVPHLRRVNALHDPIPLTERNYTWNRGQCWLGDDRVAIEGLGDEEDHLRPGARIFDAHTREELAAFGGPTGRFFGTPDHLFSVDTSGLTLWDLSDGAALTRVPGFTPTLHHAGRLWSHSGATLTGWSSPV